MRAFITSALLFLTCITLSCRTVKLDSPSGRKPTALSYKEYLKPYDSSERKPTATILTSQFLNFDDFQKLITSENHISIEATLELLKSKYPEYLKFHTLMYKSLSIQDASFEEPRAIVFGPEARFIFSFNGNQNQAGGSSFETVEYSRQKHLFQFREITFKNATFDRENLDLKDREIEFETKDILVSKANPQKCLKCHMNASPIWPTYFLWPGAYGSDDDNLIRSFDKSSWSLDNEAFFKSSTRPQSQGRLMVIKQGRPDAELNGAIRFFKGKPSHPRYKWLPAEFMEAGILRYAKGEDLSKLDYSSEAKAESARVHGHYSWPSRPNLFLQTALMKLNQDRILDKLRASGVRPNEFLSPLWLDLSEQGFRAKLASSANPIRDLSLYLRDEFRKIDFNGGSPRPEQLESEIRQNMMHRILSLKEELEIHQTNLGGSGLTYYPEPVKVQSDLEQDWMDDPEQFARIYLDQRVPPRSTRSPLT